MKKVAIVTNDHVESDFVSRIHGILSANCVSVVEDVKDAELVLSIGGDGTFLSAAASVGECEVPVLGINTGHLGFLADVSPEDVDDCLPRALKGDCVVQPRSVIEVSAVGSALEHYPFALNEVAILKHDNSSLIKIETRVNGKLLNAFMADGLIVSTPTGSTGYSLSVGGPILTPDSGCLCLSAVAPHSLSVRPVILRDDVEIDLHIHSRSTNYLLAIDGRSQSLPQTTTLHLRRAAHHVNVVKVQRREFFDTLRDKMHWGLDVR